MLFEFSQYTFRVTPSIPDDTPNHDMSLAVLQAYETYMNLSQMGWGSVITGLRNTVEHIDPEVRKALQKNVNEMIEGLALLYCFSVWDHYIDPLPGGKPKKIEDEWMAKEERQTFRAYKHVRHSVGHCFDGRRANQLREEFEAEMNGKRPLPGIVWDRDQDTIDMSQGGLALSCYQFLEYLSKEVAGHLMNDNKP